MAVSLGQSKFRKDRKSALQRPPDFPGNERGNEPSKAYRQDLPQRADVTYVNLGTLVGAPDMELVSLRLMPTRGRSLRSSPQSARNRLHGEGRQ